MGVSSSTSKGKQTRHPTKNTSNFKKTRISSEVAKPTKLPESERTEENDAMELQTIAEEMATMKQENQENNETHECCGQHGNHEHSCVDEQHETMDPAVAETLANLQKDVVDAVSTTRQQPNSPEKVTHLRHFVQRTTSAKKEKRGRAHSNVGHSPTPAND